MVKSAPEPVFTVMPRRQMDMKYANSGFTKKVTFQESAFRVAKIQNAFGSPKKEESSGLLGQIKLFAILVNLTIVLACTAILIYQGSQCIIRYLGHDTKAIMSVKKSGEATFLAYTICPAFDNAYNSTYLSEHGMDSFMYRSGWFHGLRNEVEGLDMRNHACFNISDVLKEIRIKTEYAKEPKTYITFEGDLWDENKADFKIKYDSNFGICYSMEIQPEITRRGIINVEVKAKMNIYIYLHHPGQYTNVDSKTKVYANQGEKVFIDLSDELTQNTLGEDGEIPCNANMDYTYDTCIYEAIADKMEDEFGCVVPWVPLTNLDTGTSRSICQFDNSTKEGIARRESVIDRYDYWSSSGMKELCELACSSMEVFLGLPFGGSEDPDIAFIKLYMKSTIKVKKTVLDYTWLSMLAEIGGYTGLLLGVSVVNITSLVDKFTQRIQR